MQQSRKTEQKTDMKTLNPTCYYSRSAGKGLTGHGPDAFQGAISEFARSHQTSASVRIRLIRMQSVTLQPHTCVSGRLFGVSHASQVYHRVSLQLPHLQLLICLPTDRCNNTSTCQATQHCCRLGQHHLEHLSISRAINRSVTLAPSHGEHLPGREVELFISFKTFFPRHTKISKV
jgi:hypothetical protein